MSLSAKEESRRPSPWENVIHKSGKHILAYEQHFASARYIGNQPQINMGCRIHEFEAFSETHGKGLGGVRRDPRTGKLYVDSSKLDCVSSLSRLLTRLWLQIMLVVSSSEKLPLIFHALQMQHQFQEQGADVPRLVQQQPLRIASDLNLLDADSEDDGFRLERFRARREQLENRLLMSRLIVRGRLQSAHLPSERQNRKRRRERKLARSKKQSRWTTGTQRRGSSCSCHRVEEFIAL